MLGLWSEHRFIILVTLLCLAVSLAHLLCMRESPTAKAPILDAFDYIRDAEATLSPAPASEPYYHSPAYVWFVAGILALFGHKVLAVKIVQLLLSALTGVLIYRLGLRLFSRREAAVAAFIWALYGPAVFYASEILNTALVLFLYTLALYLAIRANDDRAVWRWLLAGGVTGLAALTRPDILAFALVVCPAIVWLSLRRGRGIGVSLLAACGFVGAIAVLLTAVGIRNYEAGGRFLMLPANGGLGFYMGTNPDYAQTIGIRLQSWHLLVDKPLADGTDAEINSRGNGSYYYRKSFQFIAGDPAGYIRCLSFKVRTLVNGYELPETYDLYSARSYSPILAALVWQARGFYFPFGLLLPLGIYGAAASRRRWRELWWLWMMEIALLGSLIGYFNSSRYRLSLVPVVSLFAAVALVRLWERFRHRQYPWKGLAAVAILALVMNWPLDHFSKRFDFDAEAYALAGVQLVNGGRTDEGLSSHQRAIELAPESYYAHYLFGRSLDRVGRPEEARAEFYEAVRLEPEFYPAYADLGMMLAGSGQFDEASRSFSRSLEINPRLCTSHFYLGEILLQENRLDEALEHFTKALEINPRMHKAHNESGVAWARKGDLEKAIECFRRTVDIDPRYSVGQENLKGALSVQEKRRSQN